MQAHDPALLLDQTRWIRALARRLVSCPHAADDLVQETWVEALEHRPDARRPLRGWLATVLRNRATSHRRREALRSVRDEVAAREERAPSTLAVVERAAVHQDLVRAVLALDEPYRKTLLMRYFDELSHREIARRTGVSQATVASRIQRGLERLRGRLQNRYGSQRGFLLALSPLADRAGGALAGTGNTLGIGTKIMTSTLGIAAATLVGLTTAVGLTGLGTTARDPLEPLARSSILAAAPLGALAQGQEERGSRRRVVEVDDEHEVDHDGKHKDKRKHKGWDWSSDLTFSLPLGRGISSLAVQSGAGSIEIVESLSGSVDVDAKVRADTGRVDARDLTHVFEDHVDVFEKDGVLRIEDAHDGKNGWGVSLVVHVPAALPVNVSSGAGSVVVRHAKKSVKASSGAGRVEVHLPQGDLETLTASSGAGKVVVDVLRVAKRAKVSSGAGRVALEVRDGTSTGSFHLSSGAGQVQLTVPANVAGEFELDTGVGAIDVPEILGLHVEQKMVGAEASGRVGSGGGRYDLSSGAGSIEIKLAGTRSEPL